MSKRPLTVEESKILLLSLEEDDKVKEAVSVITEELDKVTSANVELTANLANERATCYTYMRRISDLEHELYKENKNGRSDVEPWDKS